MKGVLYLSMKMLLLMMLPMMVACGGDDDNESKKIDGVNVTTGKKLVELRLDYDNVDGYPTVVYKVEYDSKGRMNRVFYKEIEGKYDSSTRKWNYYYTGEMSEIALIDYDLGIVKIKNSNKSQSYGFVLSEDGYLSKIGLCTLNYDSNGYLLGVEEAKGFSTMVYNGNELIKASVSNLAKGNISLYFVSYEDVDNHGDLYINIKRTDDKYNNSSLLDKCNIVCLIAYQSGLFGKVTKTFIHLKSKSEVSSIVGYEDDNLSGSGKITFICE